VEEILPLNLRNVVHFEGSELIQLEGNVCKSIYSFCVSFNGSNDVFKIFVKDFN